MRREWTGALMVRMTEAAERRKAREWVMLAQVIAAGAGAGFSGDWKPIQALARELGLPIPGGAPKKGRGQEVGDLLSRLQARGKARNG